MNRFAPIVTMLALLSVPSGAAGTAPGDTVVALEWTPNGPALVERDARTLHQTGRTLLVRAEKRAVSPDRRRLALWSPARGAIEVVDLERISVAATVETPMRVASLGWSGASTVIALGGGTKVVGDRPDTVAVLDVAARHIVHHRVAPLRGMAFLAGGAIFRIRSGYPIAVTAVVGGRPSSASLSRLWYGARPWNVRDGTRRPGAARHVIRAARADLAARLGVPVRRIRLAALRKEHWTSSALGCESDGRPGLPVSGPGWRMALAVGNRLFDYRARVGRGAPHYVRPCADDVPPAFRPDAPSARRVSFVESVAVAVSPDGRRAVVAGRAAPIADLALRSPAVRWRRAFPSTWDVSGPVGTNEEILPGAVWVGGGTVAVPRRRTWPRPGPLALLDLASGRVRTLPFRPVAWDVVAAGSGRLLLKGSPDSAGRSGFVVLDRRGRLLLHLPEETYSVQVTRRYAYVFPASEPTRPQVVDLALARVVSRPTVASTLLLVGP